MQPAALFRSAPPFRKTHCVRLPAYCRAVLHAAMAILNDEADYNRGQATGNNHIVVILNASRRAFKLIVVTL